MYVVHVYEITTKGHGRKRATFPELARLQSRPGRASTNASLARRSVLGDVLCIHIYHKAFSRPQMKYVILESGARGPGIYINVVCAHICETVKTGAANLRKLTHLINGMNT